MRAIVVIFAMVVMSLLLIEMVVLVGCFIVTIMRFGVVVGFSQILFIRGLVEIFCLLFWSFSCSSGVPKKLQNSHALGFSTYSTRTVNTSPPSSLTLKWLGNSLPSFIST